MRREVDSAGSLFGRPGRLTAVGAVALICGLSVAGALGVPFTKDRAQTAQGPLAAKPSVTTAPQRPATVHTSPLSKTNVPFVHAAPNSDSSKGKAKAATTDGSATSPPVALPGHSGKGKRIVFDMTAQRVWLVRENDTVARTYLVSGSRYDNLQPGSYSVTSRSRYATAYNSNETLNYMVRFAYGRTAPIGFHAIPVRPDGSLVEKRTGLGKPASDGCVRQWIGDASALWRFAPDGTSVVVLA